MSSIKSGKYYTSLLLLFSFVSFYLAFIFHSFCACTPLGNDYNHKCFFISKCLLYNLFSIEQTEKGSMKCYGEVE